MLRETVLTSRSFRYRFRSQRTHCHHCCLSFQAHFFLREAFPKSYRAFTGLKFVCNLYPWGFSLTQDWRTSWPPDLSCFWSVKTSPNSLRTAHFNPESSIWFLNFYVLLIHVKLSSLSRLGPQNCRILYSPSGWDSWGSEWLERSFEC